MRPEGSCIVANDSGKKGIAVDNVTATTIFDEYSGFEVPPNYFESTIVQTRLRATRKGHKCNAKRANKLKDHPSRDNIVFSLVVWVISKEIGCLFVCLFGL